MTAMDTIRHPSFSKGHPRLQTTMRPARGKFDGDKSSRVAVVVVARHCDGATSLGPCRMGKWEGWRREIWRKQSLFSPIGNMRP